MTDEHRTPVSLTGLPADDPHLQPAARNPELVERVISVCFIVGALCLAGFGACYWIDAQAWKLGATLGGGLLFLGIGIVAWGKYLMPRGPFVEERHTLANSEADRQAFAAAIVERGGGVVQRRKLLGGLLGGGTGIFTIVAMFPLLRSLGPLPKTTLQHTDWRSGSFVVDQSGRRVQVGDLAVGSIETVFPEGTENSDRGQAVHQSMFNVTNGAVPQFGPAPRPLPQLPLYVDSSGYLRSQGDYHEAVGPGFWERS